MNITLIHAIFYVSYLLKLGCWKVEWLIICITLNEMHLHSHQGPSGQGKLKTAGSFYTSLSKLQTMHMAGKRIITVDVALIKRFHIMFPKVLKLCCPAKLDVWSVP